MQSSALFVVEVVTTARENLIERYELDDLAIRKIGRLVQDEAAIFDVRFDGVHG